MITSTPSGLFCSAGGFHIDPWQPVERAVITHAHSDHASPGSANYLCAAPGEQILRRRLPDAHVETLPYGESVTIGDTRVSFHPAGHILGSAQVRVEHRGEVWVVSGDYKCQPDPTCAPFETVTCHTFITEATFALPIYTWDPAGSVVDEMLEWWRGNREQERPSVVFCYVLGKAQRILAELRDKADGPIHLHGAMSALTEAYRESLIPMAPAERITEGMRGKALREVARARAAFRAWYAMDAPPAERVDRLRIGLDARSRRPAAAGLRSRFRPLRPCRLVRLAFDHPRHRRFACARDTRLVGSACPLSSGDARTGNGDAAHGIRG